MTLVPTVPVTNTRALHYVTVMTRVAKGSGLVRQLLHIGHYAAPGICAETRPAVLLTGKIKCGRAFICLDR